jgi:hypothetical protein
MNGPYAKEYWKAAQIEIETLERIQAWTVVPHTNNITNVLPSTWAFKVNSLSAKSVLAGEKLVAEYSNSTWE